MRTCKNGHELNEKTIYINATSGCEICRKCRAASQKRGRENERKSMKLRKNKFSAANYQIE